MKNKLLLLCFCTLLFNITNAQQVYKGPGTSNSTFLFGYTSYAAKSQCIFWPSDFTNLVSGNITRIYYHYGTGTGDQVLTRFEIKMGQKTDTGYTNNNFFTGLTQVFYRNSYTIPQGVSGEWFYIDLDTPFAYDSTKTLVVQLIFPESAIDSWGTLGTSNTPVKKIISPDTLATVGDPSSSTWQDFGFDVTASNGIKSYVSNHTILDFMIAPNPAQNQIQVKILNTTRNNTELTIYNALGETLLQYRPSNSTETIDLSAFTDGIYFVMLSDENGKTQQKKFVISR